MSPRAADFQGQARANGDAVVLFTLVVPYLCGTKLENESSMQNHSLTFTLSRNNQAPKSLAKVGVAVRLEFKR